MANMKKTVIVSKNISNNRLVWEIKKCLSGFCGVAYIEKNGRNAVASSAVGVSSLNIQNGDSITVKIADRDASSVELYLEKLTALFTES